MAKSKPRVSRHNGRAGKHGVYNPKHNDRQFDVAHAGNIDRGRTGLNLYWDWQNGLRDHEANQSGRYPTFNQGSENSTSNATAAILPDRQPAT